jgi:hypothetical protein
MRSLYDQRKILRPSKKTSNTVGTLRYVREKEINRENTYIFCRFFWQKTPGPWSD